MTRYGPRELRTFLKAVDRHAAKGTRLVIIGGAAAALSFGVDGGTLDIDAAVNVDGLRAACEAAREDTGLRIPLEKATVFEAPRHFLRRARPVPLRGLRRLKLLTPEKHDWALMKAVRLEDKDVAHLKAVSRNRGLRLPTLEDRLLDEMGHVLLRERLVLHFLALVEELYGEAAAARTEQRIRKHPDWTPRRIRP